MTNDAARNQVFEGLSAQRAACDLNSRPPANQRDIVNTWAKDMTIALDKGNTDEARRLALELRPYLSMLREG